jgi:hypothetical protein
VTVTREEALRKKAREYEENLIGVDPKRRIIQDMLMAIILFVFCTITQIFDVYHRYMNPYLRYSILYIILIHEVTC